MDDRHDELEHRLQRLRPIGPAPALRGRVLRAASAPRRRDWIAWWSVAAALCGALLLQWRSGQLYDRLAAAGERAEAADRQHQIDLVTQAWGGTASARTSAEAALTQIEIKVSTETPAGQPPAGQGP